MEVVNIQDAKTQLSKLVEEVLAGKEIVIAKAGKPLVRLTPFQPALAPRKLGALVGAVTEAPDCWEPDGEIESLFYGEEVVSLRVAEEPEK